MQNDLSDMPYSVGAIGIILWGLPELLLETKW